MVQHPSRPVRSGRPRAVDPEQVVAAAVQLADDEGLDAVTLRALGDRLGVSAMAVHRTSGGIDALRRTLVGRLVGEATATVRWGEDWEDVVRTFARSLRTLLLRHPLVLEAHRQAPLEAPGADAVAHRVVEALAAAGLSAEDAAYGYATVHDFVTGHVAIRLGRGELELERLSSERRIASVFADHHDYDQRFETGLDIVLGGLRARADADREARRG
ncbi:TetR/AcrR family transcriptional regulator [Leifsonia naganoensis]|uniref:AcrR family transcriptional regulator n=1 Tax=Leifsonia naganoensis TaxID=150025 RepID=A0A853DRP2_9MICO|nr:TetR/AcrR family transcriptional regulator C-terminal domain-containing protein [Leifsonia naganoensis]NYK09021.1 AcrR family transcriptional regulator [Leifsonia naganoensis]